MSASFRYPEGPPGNEVGPPSRGNESGRPTAAVFAGCAELNTTTARPAKERLELRHDVIEAIIHHRQLSPSWADERIYPGPFLLPKLPFIVMNRGKGTYSAESQFEWLDAETGAGGIGKISLVAYVRKITTHEAALRMARFAILSDPYLSRRYVIGGES